MNTTRPHRLVVVDSHDERLCFCFVSRSMHLQKTLTLFFICLISVAIIQYLKNSFFYIRTAFEWIEFHSSVYQPRKNFVDKFNVIFECNISPNTAIVNKRYYV